VTARRPTPRLAARTGIGLAAVGALLATGLSACGDGVVPTPPGADGTAAATSGTGTGDPSTPSGSSDPQASPSSPLDRIARAKGVLAAAGLELPPSTATADVTQIPKDPYTERFLVTLTAPKAQLDAMCKAAGLGGPFPAVGLTAEEKDAFGMQTAPPGARLCSGLSPNDFAHQREVLYVGDPATVWIAVWRMPSR
jgi:hypothetical protein